MKSSRNAHPEIGIDIKGNRLTSGEPRTSALQASLQVKIRFRNATGISHPIASWQ